MKGVGCIHKKGCGATIKLLILVKGNAVRENDDCTFLCKTLYSARIPLGLLIITDPPQHKGSVITYPQNIDFQAIPPLT